MQLRTSSISISWIPPDAMTGPMRLPMDLHIGHYDDPPPDRVVPEDLESLRRADRYRFANHLAVWAEVEEGNIVDAGYSGGAYVGSTTATLGFSVTIPGVEFPVLQTPPRIEGDRVRFVQTAGGRTGAPLPRTIDRPPYVRLTSPTAWTTLAATVSADGTVEHEVVGASPFPRHWMYGPEGDLVSKSGVIDFHEWTRHYDQVHTPWHHEDRTPLMSHVESQIERSLSSAVMSGKPELINVPEGEFLLEQGVPCAMIYLVLDGMLTVSVDGEEVGELGPGAIVGERAVLEGGHATASVRAETPVRTARIRGDQIDRSDLAKVAAEHPRGT